jgi:hypothetical protein
MAGTNPYTGLYPTSSGGKELDLRNEFYRTLYGAVDEEAKGRQGLLRKMRRNSDGDPIRCVCRDIVTDEPDKDYYCRYCLGMGYYWDEIKIIYYRNEKATNNDFFLEYNVAVTLIDYIITVNLDIDGNPTAPVTRDKVFKIVKVDSFQADNGRIEFWRVRAEEERKWSTWYGQQNRQYN